MIIEGLDTHLERRNTHCVKWDTCAPHELPLWVADMDFAPPRIVQEAIINRLNHPTLGYSFATKGWDTAVKHWCESQQGFRPQQIIPLQGVMTGLHAGVLVSTNQDDAVLIQSPVYHPFTSIPQYLKRRRVECPLKIKIETKPDHLGQRDIEMSIDFEILESKIKTENVKAIIMSSPHNPGGVIFSKNDLIKMGELALKYNLTIIADEIHSDTLRVGGSFTSYGRLIVEKAWGDNMPNIIAIQAPTKTFSLAGISSAWAMASTTKLASDFEATIKGLGVEVINILSYEAAQAVYEKGLPWLARTREAMNSNLAYLDQEVKNFNLQNARSERETLGARIPDATYLYWLWVGDCGGADSKSFVADLRTKGLRLNPGAQFGLGGEGFVRINIATHLDTLKKAWQILKQSLISK